MTTQQHHENFSSKKIDSIKDRTFGMIISALLALASIYLFFQNSQFYKWTGLTTVLVLLISIIKPSWLKPIKIIWSKVGSFIQHLVSQVVLGLIFYTIILTTKLILKFLKKEPIKLKINKELKTYWIKKEKNYQNNFKNQF